MGQSGLYKEGDKVKVARRWSRDESDVGFGLLTVGKELKLLDWNEKFSAWNAESDGALGHARWTVPECAIELVEPKVSEFAAIAAEKCVQSIIDQTSPIRTVHAMLPVFEGYTFVGLKAAKCGEYVLEEDTEELKKCNTDMWVVAPVWTKDAKARTPVLPADWDKVCRFWDMGESNKQQYRLRGQAGSRWMDEDGDMWDYCEIVDD